VETVDGSAARMARVKGTCPICLRAVSLRDDRSLLAHNRRRTRKGQEPEPCPGSGHQPLDQSRLDV